MRGHLSGCPNCIFCEPNCTLHWNEPATRGHPSCRDNYWVSSHHRFYCMINTLHVLSDGHKRRGWVRGKSIPFFISFDKNTIHGTNLINENLTFIGCMACVVHWNWTWSPLPSLCLPLFATMPSSLYLRVNSLCTC